MRRPRRCAAPQPQAPPPACVAEVRVKVVCGVGVSQWSGLLGLWVGAARVVVSPPGCFYRSGSGAHRARVRVIGLEGPPASHPVLLPHLLPLEP